VLALARVAGLVKLLQAEAFLRQRATNVYAEIAQRLHPIHRTTLPTELTSTNFDARLAAWYRAWGHVFFHRAWLWVGLGAALVGPAVVLAELAQGRSALYEIGGSLAWTVLLLVILALATLAVHELGHGLAVKHAGRRVHRAGVRLYYGLPAAYVDTTDVWMAPPAMRLLTAFAGPWTGLVLGGALAIAAIAIPDGAIGAFLFTAAFVFLVDNIFNFNPLLELDGYYMLVDLLDKPLLRPRALGFVRGPLLGKLRRRERLSGEERLFTLFGLAAAGYAVLAVIIAVRAWQAVALPLIVAGLQSQELLARLGVLVVLAAIAVPVGLSAIGLARQLLEPASISLLWLSGRAAAHRHRAALAALRAVPLWSELPQPRLLEVARLMRAEDVARGTEVVRQGERGTRFYLIAEGAFEVYVDGQPVVRLGRGDYFGERALLHGTPRAATVVAVEHGRVFALDHQAFDALLASDLAARQRLEAALAYREEVEAMPMLQSLSPAELDVLLANMVPLSAAPREAIIRQGEPGQRFYVVRSGAVDVLRDGLVLARLGPGEAFGEIALLLDVPRTASVIAVEPTELLALEASAFRDLLAGYLGRAGELERLSYLRLRTHKRLDEIV
jgi:putative peptide zinc metalloprotease protein